MKLWLFGLVNLCEMQLTGSDPTYNQREGTGEDGLTRSTSRRPSKYSDGEAVQWGHLPFGLPSPNGQGADYDPGSQLQAACGLTGRVDAESFSSTCAQLRDDLAPPKTSGGAAGCTLGLGSEDGADDKTDLMRWGWFSNQAGYRRDRETDINAPSWTPSQSRTLRTLAAFSKAPTSG